MPDAPLPAPTRPGPPARTEPDPRAGSTPDLPLPAALLEPIGEGIACCPALWEPLAADAAAGPVPLFATEGYDVWLEAHRPGTRLEPRRPDATHTLTAVRGSLRLRPSTPVGHRAAAVAVAPGQTSVVATATDVLIENPGVDAALAIHVRSADRAREAAGDARFPAPVASVLSHPARHRRPDHPAGDRTGLAASAGRYPWSA